MVLWVSMASVSLKTPSLFDEILGNTWILRKDMGAHPAVCGGGTAATPTGYSSVS